MAKTKGATAQTLDMTNVQDGVGFNKRRQREGDYKAKIVSVQNAKKKDDASKKMWLFAIQIGSGTYPFYCGFGEKELWKIRNLFQAAGIAIARKKTQLDPNKLVGKYIGATLGDTEYDGKNQSQIEATFPVSELEDSELEDEGDTEEEEDDEEEAPAKKQKAEVKKDKKGKKDKKSTKVTDEELEELDVDEI